MAQKILVFGLIGQVARELHKRRPDAIYLDQPDADLTDLAAVEAVIAAHAPDAVINAAAYTAVDKAEDEKELADLINGRAPGVMARACAARGIPFVHISTDYVFDGTGETPWTEDMHADPVNHYGASKLLGEQEVIAAGGSYAILRTAWVFAGHGGNFVRTMLRLAETRDALNVVDDQYGAPTWAGDIADALLVMTDALLAGKGESGVYHFTGAPYANWADFARAIFAQAGKDVTVTGIPASDYPTPAARPANSRMDCQKIARVFGVSQPDWRKSLDIVLEELGSNADAT